MCFGGDSPINLPVATSRATMGSPRQKFALHFKKRGFVTGQTASSNMCVKPVEVPIHFGNARNQKHIHRLPCPPVTAQQGLPSQLKIPNPIKQISSITPVKFDRLALFLRGYDQDAFEFLENGFSEGFALKFHGTRSYRESPNLMSAIANPDTLLQKIHTEIALNRIAGPFSFPPFANLQISPLGLVPKKAPGEYRLIHHLSFPDGASINDGIDAADKSVHYETLDDAIFQINNFGPGALLSKTDLESAFRILPVRPADYELLGMMIGENYYYDKCLPMGCAISCQLFEKFSSALHWIMQYYFKATGVVHVLDDFLFIGAPGTPQCQLLLDHFLDMCLKVGVPIKHEKTVQPTTCITFLGIELDTQTMVARLPIEKVDKISLALADFRQRQKVTLVDLQSLIGLLNFACRVVVPGRTWLRRLIDLTKGLTQPFHHVRLTADAKADLEVWSIFIHHFNNSTMFLSNHWDTNAQLQLFTDASNLGFGALLESQWFYGEWDIAMQTHHINIKELFPITVALELWGKRLENKSVLFFSDNETVVAIINKQTSPNPHMMALLRRLVTVSLCFNIRFRAKHIPGTENVLADALSRLQVRAFRKTAPHMDRLPTRVPDRLLHI